jgi:hypothetical protein
MTAACLPSIAGGFLLIFTFKPGVKIANALRRVKEFFGMVGDADGHRISWAASLGKTSLSSTG